MRFIIIIVVLLIAAVAILAGTSYWVYSSLTSPVEHAKANEYITIEKGSTPGQIIQKLASEGILSSTTPVQLYLRFSGNANKFQAGEYQFPSPITALKVLQELEKGEERMTRLTIPEGFTRFDIAKRILEKFPQNPPMTEDAVVKLMDDTSLVKDIAPDARNLGGYMYPSTYNFPRETPARDVIKAMVEQFRKVWKPEWTEKARTLGRKPSEIVTIASLIETESGVESERPIVASVIYNRLSKSIPLGIDQTVVYVAKMEGRWDGTIHRSDLDVNSPYNTRKFGGLPPGPISSVSESALQAALEPADTDYIFYVRNVQLNDGSHWFYASAAEFERGKAEYQRWLESERQKLREQQAVPQ